MPEGFLAASPLKLYRELTEQSKAIIDAYIFIDLTDEMKQNAITGKEVIEPSPITVEELRKHYAIELQTSRLENGENSFLMVRLAMQRQTTWDIRTNAGKPVPIDHLVNLLDNLPHLQLKPVHSSRR